MSFKILKNKLLFFIVLILLVICLILSFVILTNTIKIRKYSSYIKTLSKTYDIDQNLIFAIIKVESNFNPKAISSKNAKGLMQIKQSTFDFICKKYNFSYKSEQILDPKINLNVGVAYLNYLSGKFYFDQEILSAYNAGEGNVSSWLKDKNFSDDGVRLKSLPFKETSNYIKKVNFYKNFYKGIFYESSSSTCIKSSLALRRKIN